MNISETAGTIRTQLAERRMVRQQRRRISQELDSFRSPAERAELEAILARATDDEIAELEALLGRSLDRI
jgi:hypothetical protein